MSPESLSTEKPPSTPPAALVYIVIVNYNSADYTRVCLRSLERLNYANIRVLVLDNYSSSDDISELGNFVRPRGSFIRIPENRGFAAANNIGIHQALLAGAKYVWLLNPDTVVHPDALTSLVRFCESRSDCVVCGSKVLYGELDADSALAECSGNSDALPGRIWSAGGKIDSHAQQVSMIGWGEKDGDKFAENFECDYLPGCSMLVSAEALTKAGEMPEEFFMYFEETEWCTRMRGAGIKLFCVPNSVIWHRFDDSKMQSPGTVYYYNRNCMHFWKTHGSASQRRKQFYQTLFRRLPGAVYAVLKAPNTEARKIFRAHRRACVDFLLGRMGRRR